MKFFNRRDFIKVSGMTGAAVAMSGVGPAWASATTENKRAVADAVIKKLTGGAAIKKGPVQIVTQVIAEDGAVVPITINTGKAKITRLAVVVDNNPEPLIFEVKINPDLAGDGMISTRIRMRETSNLRVFAFDSDGNIFGDTRLVKVTIGGC